MTSAKQSTKELKGKNGKCCIVTTEMSKATGAKKPSESQKSESLLGNEGGLASPCRRDGVQLCWCEDFAKNIWEKSA